MTHTPNAPAPAPTAPGVPGGLTPREVRLCREAVERAVGEMAPRIGDAFFAVRNWEGSCALAARLYPMPLVAVPRVLVIEGDQHRVMNGALQWAHLNDRDWQPRANVPARLIPQFAELFANPTEQRPADEVSHDRA